MAAAGRRRGLSRRSLIALFAGRAGHRCATAIIQKSCQKSPKILKSKLKVELKSTVNEACTAGPAAFESSRLHGA
jgi:hypothetical protein